MHEGTKTRLPAPEFYLCNSVELTPALLGLLLRRTAAGEIIAAQTVLQQQVQHTLEIVGREVVDLNRAAVVASFDTDLGAEPLDQTLLNLL